MTRICQAGVARDVTPEAGLGLGLGVGHQVPATTAAALEGVVEPEPVAGLVDHRVAEVVATGGAAAHAGHVDADAVELGRSGVLPWEPGPAEDRGAPRTAAADVEVQ